MFNFKRRREFGTCSRRTQRSVPGTNGPPVEVLLVSRLLSLGLLPLNLVPGPKKVIFATLAVNKVPSLMNPSSFMFIMSAWNQNLPPGPSTTHNSSCSPGLWRAADWCNLLYPIMHLTKDRQHVHQLQNRSEPASGPEPKGDVKA